MSRMALEPTRRLLRWSLAGACALLLGAPAAAQAVRALDWQALRAPAPAAEADDPFERLAPEHLDALREIVLGRTLEARGRPLGDAALAQRAALKAQLAAAGLDADALLAARERLIAARRAQAETPVAEIDGQSVRLSGFLVRGSARGQGVDEVLLVPWAGACSHTPPPPANQVVRLDAAAVSALAGSAQPGERVAVSGTLRVRMHEQTLFVGDGVIAVRSAYEMDHASAARSASDALPAR